MLALISVYAPVVIIILAVIAVLFSFFWVFLPLPGWMSKRDGQALDSVLALASAKAVGPEIAGRGTFQTPSVFYLSR